MRPKADGESYKYLRISLSRATDDVHLGKPRRALVDCWRTAGLPRLRRTTILLYAYYSLATARIEDRLLR